MNENETENLQTWPRAQQLSAKFRNELNDWIQNENELCKAKAYIATQKEQTELGTLIGSICDLIEQGNEKELLVVKTMMANGIESTQGRKISMANSRGGTVSIMPSGATAQNNRKAQQQMQSMILCKLPPKNPQAVGSRKSSDAGLMRKKRPTPALLQGMQQLGEEDEEGKGDLEAQKISEQELIIPWALQMLPNLSILLSSLIYLIGGAAIFRILDNEIAEKPFRWAVILTFETCATIGWGDSKPTNRWSQAFCVVYTIFGVPILFSAFANIGRLISHFYTVDWLFLTGVVRKKIDGNQHRLPIKRAVNFIFLHQFIGALLYSGLVKDLPVITAIYFSITSMGTIGIGDYHPDTKNAAEAIVSLLFIGSGIILLSALLLSINYYYQAIFFIWLRDKLHALWKMKWQK